MYSREEQKRAIYYYDDGRRKRLSQKENLAYLFNIFSMPIAIYCVCLSIGALLFRDSYSDYWIINLPMIYVIYRLYKKLK